jgi:hypothetical protein
VVGEDRVGVTVDLGVPGDAGSVVLCDGKIETAEAGTRRADPGSLRHVHHLRSGDVRR